jgi:insulysin
VNDSLTEYAYDADLAGLSYNLSLSSLGVFIVLSGYNDKLHVLLQHILKKVKTLQVEPDRLEVIKEQVRSSTLFTNRLLMGMSA